MAISETYHNISPICVVTGGLLTTSEPSILGALKKQYKQFKESKHHWLETKIKVVSAEPIILSRLQKKKSLVKEYFNQSKVYPPNLTEVVLVDEIIKQKLKALPLSLDQLFNDKEKRDATLQKSEVIFLSSTLLHDLSELHAILKIIEPYNKKLVLGGALAGSLYKEWDGHPAVNILAIGYGEYLIPVLCDWIKSDYKKLIPPPLGRIEQKTHTTFLFSGHPLSKSLDWIKKPDWKHANKIHGKQFKKIYYESVRGCPYRCSFCNYPFLFDDKVFRKKSAEKIAEDWASYKAEGVEHIVCLDSLFTMPRKRIETLCDLLIDREINIKWTCYARADDLLDLDLVMKMKAAGASQFQIGIESGSQEILDAMNKRCTVESNYLAIQNCRLAGITTVTSIIVGFPGETKETVDKTLSFLAQAQPDFHFLATFSVRVEDVPILNQKNRNKYGLSKMDNPLTFAPYWKHDSMSAAEAGQQVRRMNEFLFRNKISLDGAVFYENIDSYSAKYRSALLDYQYDFWINHKLVSNVFNFANSYIDNKLEKDIATCLP